MRYNNTINRKESLPVNGAVTPHQPEYRLQYRSTAVGIPAIFRSAERVSPDPNEAQGHITNLFDMYSAQAMRGFGRRPAGTAISKESEPLGAWPRGWAKTTSQSQKGITASHARVLLPSDWTQAFTEPVTYVSPDWAGLPPPDSRSV
ncbi:hypothetical protein PGT21_031697 [Puccinia graminis f. sp. tritici]|uniref:Uncharacterized protein n=1 Tax=Puccinia graminis f. sp. tritici TaxID=56615 RepID=A0A5B0NDM7_PUCGR|nr:hypothetical protein PGT21_031697 [Puccinia graminis f. sp. tritici]